MKKMARNPQVTGLLDYIWTIENNMMLVSEAFESRYTRYQRFLPERRYGDSDEGWSFERARGLVWFTAPMIEESLIEQDYATVESLRKIGAILWNTFHIFFDACKLSRDVKEVDWLKKGRSVRVVFLDGSVKIYRPIRPPKRKRFVPPEQPIQKSTGGGPKTPRRS